MVYCCVVNAKVGNDTVNQGFVQLQTFNLLTKKINGFIEIIFIDALNQAYGGFLMIRNI